MKAKDRELNLDTRADPGSASQGILQSAKKYFLPRAAGRGVEGLSLELMAQLRSGTGSGGKCINPPRTIFTIGKGAEGRASGTPGLLLSLRPMAEPRAASQEQMDPTIYQKIIFTTEAKGQAKC